MTAKPLSSINCPVSRQLMFSSAAPGAANITSIVSKPFPPIHLISSCRGRLGSFMAPRRMVNSFHAERRTYQLAAGEGLSALSPPLRPNSFPSFSLPPITDDNQHQSQRHQPYSPCRRQGTVIQSFNGWKHL